MTKFGNELKKIRENRNMSLTELARLTNFSKSYISRIEHGNSSIPKPETIIKIAQALNISRTPLLKAAGYWDEHEEVQKDIKAKSEHIKIANFQPLDGIQYIVGAPRTYTLVDEFNITREASDDDVLDLYYLLNMSIATTNSVNEKNFNEEQFKEVKENSPKDILEMSNVPIKYKGRVLSRHQKEQLLYTLKLIFEQ